MAKHKEKFCGAKEFNINKPTLMKELMHCVCGFSTNSGNKMAGHLARSGCTSAYPSSEEARKAKVGDDSDDTEETTDNDSNQDKGQSSQETQETADKKDGEGEGEKVSGPVCDANDELSKETKENEENQEDGKDDGAESLSNEREIEEETGANEKND